MSQNKDLGTEAVVPVDRGRESETSYNTDPQVSGSEGGSVYPPHSGGL